MATLATTSDRRVQGRPVVAERDHHAVRAGVRRSSQPGRHPRRTAARQTCLARVGRAALTPAAVAVYIAGAYWFTASTSFANPAVTAARTLTDTFAGCAPSSVLGLVLAQLAGTAVAIAFVRTVFPESEADRRDEAQGCSAEHP